MRVGYFGDFGSMMGSAPGDCYGKALLRDLLMGGCGGMEMVRASREGRWVISGRHVSSGLSTDRYLSNMAP